MEAVNLDEPAPLSTGADAVPEPACRGSEEFPPFQPEKNADQSAQLPQTVVISIDSRAARVEGAKSVPSGARGVQTRSKTVDPDRAPRAHPGKSSLPGHGRRSSPGTGTRWQKSRCAWSRYDRITGSKNEVSPGVVAACFGARPDS